MQTFRFDVRNKSKFSFPSLPWLYCLIKIIIITTVVVIIVLCLSLNIRTQAACPIHDVH